VTDSERVEIGRVGRPHGLDGSFYVAVPEDEALTVGRRVEVAGAAAEIERRAGTAAKPIVRVSGCASRDAAEALRGTPLLVERSELPALAEGEFWADDLVGCAVSDGDIPVGTVSRLIGLPSCEVIEVRRDAGEPLLVPLVSDAVRSIDLASRRVDVDLVFLGER
jgi:16S rRNA processing protein RimM